MVVVMQSLTEVRVAADQLTLCSLLSCVGVRTLSLDCPSLSRLMLEGCDHLGRAELNRVQLPALNLGICPRLTALSVRSTTLTTLELGGCGRLSELEVKCPALQSLDCRYCSQLSDSCLERLAATSPGISSLILAACPALSSSGLTSLGSLRALTSLDLSYTFLHTLDPVFEQCSQLKVLKLSACKSLNESALLALCACAQVSASSALPTVTEPGSRESKGRQLQGGALPFLTDLDVSYTSLGSVAAEHLVMHCPNLQHLSFNGCLNIGDSFWTCLSAPPFAHHHQLPLPRQEAHLGPTPGALPASIGAPQPRGGAAAVASGARPAPVNARAAGATAVEALGTPPEAAPIAMSVEAPQEAPVAAQDSAQATGGVQPAGPPTAPATVSATAAVARGSTLVSLIGKVGLASLTRCSLGARGLSPAHPVRALSTLSLVGCSKLKRMDVSLDASCPSLTVLNLTWAKALVSVSLASSSLHTLHLRQAVFFFFPFFPSTQHAPSHVAWFLVTGTWSRIPASSQ